ncbi:MAG TPA: quinol:electron acceptor oxidoreductase subunit ActD, partial [Bdellovibrio sp.]|nr:quinol:electron acceptor oxidoreductase subunit ActD [Bdellovibrio sp.]
LPAFIPIMFELTVLFAALCSVAALFYACKIPRIDPPVIDPDLSSHKFAIFVPANDTGYDEAKIEKMFKELGALEVKKTEY